VTPIENHLTVWRDRTLNINEEKYLTTKQLCERIHFAAGTINNYVSNGKFIEGIHFHKPGGKTRLWHWGAIRKWVERKPPVSVGSKCRIGKKAA